MSRHPRPYLHAPLLQGAKFLLFRCPVRLHSVRIFLLRGTVLIALFFLAGCAVWSGGPGLPQDRKLRVAVLPVANGTEISSLSEIETLPSTTVPLPEEQNQVRSRMQAVTDGMTRALEERLGASPYFDVTPHEQTVGALVREGIAPDTAKPAREDLQRLGRALDVPAVLAVTLSGYGHLKRKWVIYLIGSGVAEGLIEGALVYGATSRAWAGVVVGGEEIIQEVLTWGGGAYFFNWYYAPVTMDGELLDTADGGTIWSDTVFDDIDRKALKKLPEGQRSRKEVQLRVTAEKVTKDLTEGLEKAVRKHLWKTRIAGSP